MTETSSIGERKKKYTIVWGKHSSPQQHLHFADMASAERAARDLKNLTSWLFIVDMQTGQVTDMHEKFKKGAFRDAMKAAEGTVIGSGK